MAKDLYIGLISGTSADAIDTVITDLSESPKIIATHSQKFTPQIQMQIRELMHNSENELHKIAQADRNLGIAFSEAVNNILYDNKIDKKNIIAIGSHGQTIRHHPNLNPAYSLQIGDPNTIAALTGIKTVADFRRRDIAIGGQGAPLTPAFHKYWLQNHSQQIAVVNLGGFCNVTLLPKDRSKTVGFDTGPANALLDTWYRKQCPEKKLRL